MRGDEFEIRVSISNVNDRRFRTVLNDYSRLPSTSRSLQNEKVSVESLMPLIRVKNFFATKMSVFSGNIFFSEQASYCSLNFGEYIVCISIL